MTPFHGPAWRLIAAGADPLAPAENPEGRFHHSGQRALYTSLSPQGCAVAIARYLRPGDPPRCLVRLHLHLDRCADLRGNPDASIVWQDGLRPSPTWAFSDAARAAGAQAMLYSSRSRPDLTHLVLFADPVTLTLGADPSEPWTAP